MPQPFHLAIPVHALGAARGFYGGLFGCPEGRSSDEWVDFDFFGHQVVAHLDPGRKQHVHHNEVDGHDVPVPHFGVVCNGMPGMRWPNGCARRAPISPSSPAFASPARSASRRRCSSSTLPATRSSSRRSRILRGCSRSDGAAARAGAQRQAHQSGIHLLREIFGCASCSRSSSRRSSLAHAASSSARASDRNPAAACWRWRP